MMGPAVRIPHFDQIVIYVKMLIGELVLLHAHCVMVMQFTSLLILFEYVSIVNDFITTVGVFLASFLFELLNNCNTLILINGQFFYKREIVDLALYIASGASQIAHYNNLDTFKLKQWIKQILNVKKKKK